MNWREIRLGRSGRRGWDIALPRFEDEEKPDGAERMNRFYGTAAAEMEKAADLAAQTDARRVLYRCRTDVRILTEGDCAAQERRADPEPSGKKRFLRILPRLFRRDGKRAGIPRSVTGRPGDVRVALRLSLAVSGRRTREKTLVQLWRDGVLLSSRVH